MKVSDEFCIEAHRSGLSGSQLGRQHGVSKSVALNWKRRGAALLYERKAVRRMPNTVTVGEIVSERCPSKVAALIGSVLSGAKEFRWGV